MFPEIINTHLDNKKLYKISYLNSSLKLKVTMENYSLSFELLW